MKKEQEEQALKISFHTKSISLDFKCVMDDEEADKFVKAYFFPLLDEMPQNKYMDNISNEMIDSIKDQLREQLGDDGIIRD